MLSIVPTPIGNLKDITLRALEVLKNCDFVISEDTREGGKLLKLLNLPKKQFISYRDQNHDKIFPKILELLKEGKHLALISDRGTPCISDPGYKLVRDILNQEKNILRKAPQSNCAGQVQDDKQNNCHGEPACLSGRKTEPSTLIQIIPGPSSITSALVASGLPTDRFTFLGFLPRRPGKRKKVLEKYCQEDVTFIIFESPYRIHKLLGELEELFGNIDIALVKDLTKLHEKIYREKISEVKDNLSEKLKGEWVVVGRR